MKGIVALQLWCLGLPVIYQFTKLGDIKKGHQLNTPTSEQKDVRKQSSLYFFFFVFQKIQHTGLCMDPSIRVVVKLMWLSSSGGATSSLLSSSSYGPWLKVKRNASSSQISLVFQASLFSLGPRPREVCLPDPQHQPHLQTVSGRPIPRPRPAFLNHKAGGWCLAVSVWTHPPEDCDVGSSVTTTNLDVKGFY